jgi:hypothetical protein
VRARTVHAEDSKAGVPLTETFHRHLSSILQSESRNPEVQTRFARAKAAGLPGPDVSFSGNEANPLFHNTGGGFVEIGTTLGISRTEDSRGFVLVDLDRDGAQDVVLHNYFRNPTVALLNRAAGGSRWMRVRLRGTASNRFGIGARVTVNGRVQELACGSGYQSGNAPELHFGLGKAERADVRVRWPSGKTQEHRRLEADRVYTLVEGDHQAKGEALAPVSVPAGRWPDRPAEPDVRAMLKGLRTLRGQPSPVEAERVLAVFLSIDCHACVEELRRMAELEARAKELGLRLAWIALDPDPARVERDFLENRAPSMPLFPADPLPGWATPTVYLVWPGGAGKFTGRFAVTAALEEAARARK